MPRINIVRTLTGGVLAGLVIVAFNILAQVALTERVRREMDAWIPGAADRMPAGDAAVVAGVAMKLAIGVILVWLYALARPRLGPGPKAAGVIALAVWLLAAIFFSDFPLTGMMSWATYALLEAVQLVAFVAAACVGAWVYREG